MGKTRIVGLCYETEFPGKVVRLHQDEPEHFVLEIGEASVELTMTQLNSLAPALAELVDFTVKRRTMAKTLLEGG